MDAEPPPWAVIALVVDDDEVPLGQLGRDTPCDLTTLDHLLRLTLAARRLGVSIRVTAVHRDLRELVELIGVSDQLGLP
jgi:ABC-type transporter Mla MlaB component